MEIDREYIKSQMSRKEKIAYKANLGSDFHGQRSSETSAITKIG